MKLTDVDPKDYAALGLPAPESIPILTPEQERFAPTHFITAAAKGGRHFVRVQQDGKWIWREQTMKRGEW